jgi:hypothetical protein
MVHHITFDKLVDKVSLLRCTLRSDRHKVVLKKNKILHYKTTDTTINFVIFEIYCFDYEIHAKHVVMSNDVIVNLQSVCAFTKTAMATTNKTTINFILVREVMLDYNWSCSNHKNS